MLLIFTALMGVVLMPVIAWFEPSVFQRDWASIGLMMLSGLLYMGALTFYLRALQGHEASMVAPFFQSLAAVRLRACLSRPGRDAVAERNSPAVR